MVTRLVTRNPASARLTAGATRTAHLSVMDASVEVGPAFLTQAEVAQLLGVPARTLEGWRLTRSGPPWLKLGRHVRYDRDDVLAWAREQRHG